MLIDKTETVAEASANTIIRGYESPEDKQAGKPLIGISILHTDDYAGVVISTVALEGTFDEVANKLAVMNAAMAQAHVITQSNTQVKPNETI